jgi:hypothetical protein
MSHEILERLVAFWSRTFFIEPVVILSFLFCFVIALFHNYKERERIYFLIYFFIGLAMFVVTVLLIMFKILVRRDLAIYQEVSNSIFELSEFIAFYFFFNKCLQNKNCKKVLKIFLGLLLLIFLAFFTRLILPGYSTESLRNHSIFINVVEFFLLSVMCLAYFYELLTLAPQMNLLRRPSFFIVTSTFFYSVLMIPFFMLSRDISKTKISTYETLFAAHYILLTIMLIAFLKVFLCKTPITT